MNMNSAKIIELAFYTLPALITGAVAFYSFQTFSNSESQRRKLNLLKKNQKQALPIKLQAYERLALLLERINPTKLLIRVAPISVNKIDYQNLLILHIEQEFEHNLTQQIYVSDDCWTMIVTAKNTVIQNIRKISQNSEITNADKVRETLLNLLIESGDSATSVALNYLKNEVNDLI